MFYFAWADKEDTTFGPEFEVEDEQVFGFAIQHSEGDFPSLEIDIVNPRIGLLATGRKVWAWLSEDAGSGSVPLFFGRLVGVPKEIQDNVIRLTFLARPADYYEQLNALADTLKVLPYYDPIWFSKEDQMDPDNVLEGRSALWHIDRVTHEVTISDIVVPEDGTELLNNAFYDDVSVSYAHSPARRVIVEAAVKWKQRGSGSMDISNMIYAAMKAGEPEEMYGFGFNKMPVAGSLAVFGGDQMAENWPKRGDAVGAGWSVLDGRLDVVGVPPTDPVVISDKASGAKALEMFQTFGPGTFSQHWMYNMFNRSPGVVVQVINYGVPTNVYDKILVSGKFDILWLPIWRVFPTLSFAYDASRDRSELVQFEMSANVQPILTDADDEETVYLQVGTAEVDGFIEDTRRNRFFSTDRGRQSFEHLLARARAVLIARARAVNVSASIPFSDGVGLSCRMGAQLFDPRLPSGQVQGKIIAYSLVMNGSTGEKVCRVTLACSIGRGGVVNAVGGDPSYVEEGYSELGWQFYTGGVTTPFVSDIGYSGMEDYAIDDDGVDFWNINPQDYVLDLQVSGSLETQIQEVGGMWMGGNEWRGSIIKPKDPYKTPIEAIDRISSVATTFSVELVPLVGGPFETIITPTLTELELPQTIDLE